MGLIVDLLDVSTAKSEEIKQSGADQMIIEEIQKGKLYIDESAGAIFIPLFSV